MSLRRPLVRVFSRHTCRCERTGLLRAHLLTPGRANTIHSRYLSSSRSLLALPSTFEPSSAMETTTPAFLAANEALLSSLHDQVGLSWAATIVVSTLALRSAITLPIAIYQQRIIATMINLAPMLQSWAETYKVNVAKQLKTRDYDKYQKELNRQYRAKVKQIYAHHGCSRWKLFTLPYVQIPLFVSMTLSVRDLLGMPLPFYGRLHDAPLVDMSSDGFASWMDLTATDTTMFFPLLIGAGNLINVELNEWFARHQELSTTQKVMNNAMRCLALAFIPVAAHAPMAICLYWTTSSWYSVGQNLLLKIPKVRHTLGLPMIKKPAQTPSPSLESTSR
ncbi:60Kd inner membrane protein-domain-containing protein [Gongronella butleri]|nr:60Kd inner membrane protein-domain-containing protein [Gongronella butleri]